MPAAPATTSLPKHILRALGWNLNKVVPSTAEVTALNSAGVTDATVQRYAAWRRSLLLVALLPTSLSFALSILDLCQTGIAEHTKLGVGLEIAWIVASGVLAVACLLGIRFWKKPGRMALVLPLAWIATFLLPFVYALLPVGMLYHVHEIKAPTVTVNAKEKKPAVPDEDEDDEDDAGMTAVAEDPAKLEKMQAMNEMAVEFVLSGSGYLLLLPAVLSLIPGVVNGCLRIKSLMPAAQLPGWLLVCIAPAFLLFWVVILVMVNHAARSPLLVFGVILWAGAPLWYSFRGKVLVQSQITETEAARIGGTKRLVLITTLVGVGLLAAFALTSKIAGLKVVGFDKAHAVSTKIEELSNDDDEVSLEDVQHALAESTSFIYALDLSSWRFVVDFLAKLLVVTAIFSDLVLRATVSAWRNDRAFRAKEESAAYDETAAVLSGQF